MVTHPQLAFQRKDGDILLIGGVLRGGMTENLGKDGEEVIEFAGNSEMNQEPVKVLLCACKAD